jgi:hypothetical protein
VIYLYTTWDAEPLGKTHRIIIGKHMDFSKNVIETIELLRANQDTKSDDMERYYYLINNFRYNVLYNGNRFLAELEKDGFFEKTKYYEYYILYFWDEISDLLDKEYGWDFCVRTWPKIKDRELRLKIIYRYGLPSKKDYKGKYMNKLDEFARGDKEVEMALSVIERERHKQEK